jgi:hypothetical protein
MGSSNVAPAETQSLQLLASRAPVPTCDWMGSETEHGDRATQGVQRCGPSVPRLAVVPPESDGRNRVLRRVDFTFRHIENFAQPRRSTLRVET